MENIESGKASQARNLLNNLLSNSLLFQQSSQYWELLQFVTKLRNIAPFNAMLLHIQKPGIRYVTSEYEWMRKHGRKLKEGARPLVIMWPFGPVAFVYDVEDTIGKNLPDLAYEDIFQTHGAKVGERELRGALRFLAKHEIHCELIDTMDQHAGSIRRKSRREGDKVITQYHLRLNQNHTPTVRLATLIHELGHLFLGHLGSNEPLKIGSRGNLPTKQAELEAESVSYLVCTRLGISTNSERYLAGFVDQNTSIGNLPIHDVLKVANRIEHLLIPQLIPEENRERIQFYEDGKCIQQSTR